MSQRYRGPLGVVMDKVGAHMVTEKAIRQGQFAEKRANDTPKVELPGVVWQRSDFEADARGLSGGGDEQGVAILGTKRRVEIHVHGEDDDDCDRLFQGLARAFKATTGAAWFLVAGEYRDRGSEENRAATGTVLVVTFDVLVPTRLAPATMAEIETAAHEGEMTFPSSGNVEAGCAVA
jgi:hypothetical protein